MPERDDPKPLDVNSQTIIEGAVPSALEVERRPTNDGGEPLAEEVAEPEET